MILRAALLECRRPTQSCPGKGRSARRGRKLETKLLSTRIGCLDRVCINSSFASVTRRHTHECWRRHINVHHCFCRLGRGRQACGNNVKSSSSRGSSVLACASYRSARRALFHCPRHVRVRTVCDRGRKICRSSCSKT